MIPTRIQILPLRDTSHPSGRNDNEAFCHFKSAAFPFVISSEAEKSGRRAISIVPAITEVMPVDILLINKPYLFLTTPSLDLLFSGYPGGCIAKCLEINERIDLIVTREALDKTFLVLHDSLLDIIGESNVQSP